MKLDLSLMYWGLRSGHQEQLQLTLAAEAAGYETAWVAEGYGSDAVSVLGWLVAQTRRIGIGSAVMQMPARSPAMTAMTAATLDVLSGGRMKLGIGPSGTQVAGGLHGEPFSRGLRRTREQVAIIRTVLDREPVHFAGELYELPVDPGQRPLRLSIAPVQGRIPIYLAALGPRSTALAAEIADGWIPMLVFPEHFERQFRPHLERGAARSGRNLGTLDVLPNLHFWIDPDIDRARDALRPFLALYVGGMGPRDGNFYHRLVTGYGFGAAADEVQEHYLSGRYAEAEAALPAELIDAVCLCGPPEVVLAGLERFERAGIDHLSVTPAWGEDGGDRVEQLRLLAAIVEKRREDA